MAAPSTDPLSSERHRLLRRPGRPLVTFLARVTAAAGGGVLLYLGFAPRTLWWLALPAFGLLGVTVHGRRARAGFGYGVLFGLGFLLPLLRWTGIYVGPVPWLALSAAEAVFVGAAGAGMAAVVAAARRAGVGGGGVGRRGGAAVARPVRWLPVGARRLRPARRAAAARGGRRRGTAAVVRHRPGRPRAGGGRAAPGPAGGARRRRARAGRAAPRWRPVRWPRCSRPPARRRCAP